MIIANLLSLIKSPWLISSAFVLMFIYGQYWHIEALENKRIINTMHQNYLLKEQELNDILKKQKQEEPKFEKQLYDLRHAQVSNDCQSAMDWMKKQIVLK